MDLRVIHEEYIVKIIESRQIDKRFVHAILFPIKPNNLHSYGGIGQL